MAILGGFALFAAGALSTAILPPVLGSDKAKNLYTHCAAAALRGKDRVMDRATVLKENLDDITSAASDINEDLYSKEEEAAVEEARAILKAYESRKAAEKPANKKTASARKRTTKKDA